MDRRMSASGAKRTFGKAPMSAKCQSRPMRRSKTGSLFDRATEQRQRQHEADHIGPSYPTAAGRVTSIDTRPTIATVIRSLPLTMGYHSLRTTLIGVFASGGAIVRHKLRVGLVGFERLRTRRESGLGPTLIDLAGECCARQRKGGDHQSGGNERLLEHSISSLLKARHAPLTVNSELAGRWLQVTCL